MAEQILAVGLDYFFQSYFCHRIFIRSSTSGLFSGQPYYINNNNTNEFTHKYYMSTAMTWWPNVWLNTLLSVALNRLGQFWIIYCQTHTHTFTHNACILKIEPGEWRGWRIKCGGLLILLLMTVWTCFGIICAFGKDANEMQIWTCALSDRQSCWCYYKQEFIEFMLSFRPTSRMEIPIFSTNANAKTIHHQFSGPFW